MAKPHPSYDLDEQFAGLTESIKLMERQVSEYERKAAMARRCRWELVAMRDALSSPPAR